MNTLDKRLAAMRARSEKATPGPWRADDEHGLMPGAAPAWCVSRTNAASAYLGDVAYTTGAREPQDAKFIAHARADLDDLRGAVEDVLALCVDAKAAQAMPDQRAAGYLMAMRDIRAAITARLGGA